MDQRTTLSQKYIETSIRRYGQEVTSSTIARLKNIIDEENRKLTAMEDVTRKLLIRLEELNQKGYHIEFLLIYSQIVEHRIKTILRAYELIANFSILLGNPNSRVKINLKNTYEDKPLGVIIRAFHNLYGDNPLFNELEEFNKNIRIKYIHKCFSGEYEMDTLIKEATGHVQEKDIEGKFKLISMINKITKILVELQKDLEERVMFINELTENPLLGSLN